MSARNQRETKRPLYFNESKASLTEEEKNICRKVVLCTACGEDTVPEALGAEEIDQSVDKALAGQM